jgi:hypothetical protein
VLAFVILMQVLTGCPWVAPRPLYLLATAQQAQHAGDAQGEEPAALTYTLRTRLQKTDIEDELSKV